MLCALFPKAMRWLGKLDWLMAMPDPSEDYLHKLYPRDCVMLKLLGGAPSWRTVHSPNQVAHQR
jgi:hypothetical protein